MTYIYGKLEGVDGIKANPAFKDAIKNATLVYADDKEVVANYKAIGVEVKPLTKPKPIQPKKKKTTEK